MPRLSEQLRTIQGVAGGRSVAAETGEAAAAAVREAGERGEVVVDYGRFHGGLGHAPPARFVSIAGPRGIIEHTASDMAVRVGGATTLGELAATLGEAGQWVAIDGAAGAMSVGEAVAHNPAGPLRVGFRGVGPQLLGMTFVSGAGEQITVGGRTVKNVAGYDVTRMMVGNLNGLGLITELTLRTRALPEAAATLDVEGIDEPALTRSLTALLCSEGAPDALSWRQEIGGGSRLTMTYLGREGAVAVRRDAGQRWLGETFDPAAVELERSEREGRAAVAPPGGVPSARWSAAAVMKLIVPAGLSGDLVHQLRSAGPPAGSAIESLPSEGIVFFSGAWAGEEAARMDGAVLPLVERMGGLRVWMRWPGDAGSLAPVAPKPADWSVVRRVKRALDPGCVLNPGRIEPYDGGEA